jgi:signal transduction histidine kinase
MVEWILIAVLAASTVFLVVRIRRIDARLERMNNELQRVVRGNLNTRLLTNGEKALDEVIYTVNELIEQYDRMRIQSIRSDAARRSLLSSISHDIRTPLTSIIGYVDAIRDEAAISEEEKQGYIEIIYRKAAGLKLLIDDIFQMAKLDSDEMPLRLEELDLTEVMRESIIEAMPELQQSGMEQMIELPDKICLVWADQQFLQRIMGNILKNAMQYGKEGGLLGIELIEHVQEYHVLIWDKGPGVPAAAIPHVFERMYRADPSRQGASGGSGLGLSIAKALAEKQGGTIWVDSVPQEKTTFGFSVPKPAYSESG